MGSSNRPQAGNTIFFSNMTRTDCSLCATKIGHGDGGILGLSQVQRSRYYIKIYTSYQLLVHYVPNVDFFESAILQIKTLESLLGCIPMLHHTHWDYGPDFTISHQMKGCEVDM